MRALRALCALEQHEPKVYRRLLRRLIEVGAFDEAVTVGEAAIYADVEGLATHALICRGSGQHQTSRASHLRA